MRMDGFWYDLTANLAVVAALIASWGLAQDWLFQHGWRFRTVALGLFMGLAAMFSMLLAIQLPHGIIFDLRAAPLAVAGLFGGPVAALIAGGIAAAFRILLGGSGVAPGVTTILLTVCVGLAVYFMLNGRRATPLHVLAVAAGAVLAMAASTFTIPAGEYGVVLPPAAILASTFLATLGAGYAVYRGQRIAAERDLLRMALRQAPDFHYVKDIDGRFTEVNQAVVRYNGYTSAREMIGKTDFDLTDPVRAKALFDAEQQIMRTGTPQLDHDEQLTDKSGVERWFTTSKVPLFDADGRPMGLAGVTRDVTEQRRTEAALVDSRNLLNYAVEGMSDGLAMFDRTGRLVYSNDRYRGMFPLTGEVRRSGAHIREILREVVLTGEQLDLGDPEKWINTVASSLRTGGEEQVALLDGRWLHIRTRPTEHGAAMVVVSDVTTLKKAEGELRAMTSQLKVLAETDGLTGLMNRRSFDIRLEEEMARGQAEQRPVSLVIFDVDQFKAYNDSLGHPAGDECLKVVARCVQMALQRQGDVLARYGGEEFVAILPDTDEDAAFKLADRARTNLMELRLPHPRGKLGQVTISAGVATQNYSGASRGGSSQLLARADQALYEAKNAGRNRIMGWQPRRDVMAAG
ncbi:MAG: diguanylate cyclase [Devosia sp.]